MAVYNSNTGMPNPRLQGRSAVQSLQDVLREQNLMASTALDNPQRKDYWAGDVAKAAQPDPGGWKGFVADLIESPIGKAVVKAGEVISMPGRAVVATIEEIKDSLDGDPNTSFSWNDFTTNVANPMYGFGSLTGDIWEGDGFWSTWGNRLVGLAGDILTDPLTYVTFGASKALKATGSIDDIVEVGAKGARISGRGGREALAVRVLDKTGNAELSKQVARYGRSSLSSLSDDVYQQLGLDRAGVYFMGKRIKGTTRLGEAAEKGLTSMRVWSGDHFFKRASELFTLDDVKEARRALRAGNAPSERVETYLRMVISENQKRAVRSVESRVAEAGLRQLVQDVGEDTYRSVAPTLHKALEGSVAIDTLGVAERAVYDRVVQWFDGLWKSVDGAAKAVDPAATTGKIEQYFPHMLTDDALRFVTTNQSDFARGLRDVIYNPLDPAGSFKPRMKADDAFFGVKLKVEDLNVGRLNELARNAGFKGDFFETNLASVMEKYVGSYAEQMGLIARKKYLVEKGIFKKLDRVERVDKDASKALNKSLAEMKAKRTEAGKIVQSRIEEIRALIDDVAGDRLKNAEKRVAQWGTRSIKADEAVELAGRAVVRTREHLDEMARAMQESSQSVAMMFDDGVPDIVRTLENQHQKVLRSIESMRAEFADVASSADQTAFRLKQIEDELSVLRDAEETIFQFGNALQLHIDDVIDGRNISDATLGAEMLREVKSAARGDVRVAGGRDKLLQDYVDSAKFKMIHGNAEIPMKKLREFTPERVLGIVKNAARGEADIEDIRAAIVWMDAVSGGALSRDKRTEPALRRLFDTSLDADGRVAKGSLRRMAELEAWKQEIARLEKANKPAARLMTLSNDYQNAYDQVTQAVMGYWSSNKLLNEVIGVSRTESKGLPTIVQAASRQSYEENPRAFIARFLARPEYDSLHLFFGEYIDDITIVEPPSFDEFVGRLTTIAESKKGFKQTVSISRKGALGQFGAEEEVVASLNVNANKFIKDIDELVKNGDTEDVSDFLELMLSGRTASSLDPAEELPSVGVKAKGGRARRTTGGKGIEPAERVRKGIASLQERLAVEDAKAAGGLIGSADSNLRKTIIKFYLKELKQQEVASDSLLGRIASTQRELRKAEPRLNISGLKVRWADEIGSRAKSDVIDAWFAYETERRLQAISDTLVPHGLMLDDVMAQRVYRKVASEFIGETAREIDGLSRIYYDMARLARDARRGQYATTQELHDAISKLLDSNKANPHLARHAGASSGDEIRRSFELYGGRTGRRGELERINKLEIAYRNATTKAEKAAIGRQLADKSTIALKGERKRLMQEVWIPWYRSVTGKTKGRVTLQEIQIALDTYAPKASRRAEMRAAVRAIRKGADEITAATSEGVARGSIAVGASREEMLDWLDSVGGILSKTASNTRRQNFGMLAMADPFSVPSMASSGVRWAASNDMPTHIADVTSRTYQKMQEQLDLIARAKSERKALTGAVDVAETELGRTQRTVSVISKMEEDVPVRAYKGKSAPYREFSSEELKRARDIYRQVAVLSNDPNYLSGLERQELNNVLKLLAQIDPSEDVSLAFRVTDETRARKLLASGVEIYYKKADGSHVLVTSERDLRKLAEDPNRTLNQTFFIRNRGGKQVQRTREVVDDAGRTVSRETGAFKRAQAEYRKAMEDADKIEFKYTSDPKKAKANAVRAEQMRADAEKKLTEFSAPQKTSIDTFEPITSSEVSAKSSVAEIDRQLKKLNEELTQLVNPPERSRMVSSDVFDAQQEAAKVEMDRVRSQIDSLTERRNTLTSGGRIETKTFNDPITPTEIESLFLTDKLDDVGRLNVELRGLESARQEIQTEMSRVGKEINALEAKNLRIDAQLKARRISRVEADSLRALNEDAIEGLRRDMIDLRRSYERAQRRIDAADPTTRASALMKAHNILQSIKDGEITIEDLIAATSKEVSADPSLIAQRHAVLDKLWIGSDEQKAVARMGQLNRDIGTRVRNAVLQDERKLTIQLESAQRRLGDGGAAAERRLGDPLPEGVADGYAGPTAKFDMAIDVSTARVKSLKKDIDGLLEAITRQTQNQYDAKTRWRTLLADKKHAGKSPEQLFQIMKDEIAQLRPKLPKMRGAEKIDLFAGEFGGVARVRPEVFEKIQNLQDEMDYIIKNYMVGNGRSIYNDQADWLAARIGAMEELAPMYERAIAAQRKFHLQDLKEASTSRLKDVAEAEKNFNKAQKAYDDAIDRFGTATIEYGNALYSEDIERLQRHVDDLTDYVKRVNDKMPKGKIEDTKDLPFVLDLLDELNSAIARNGEYGLAPSTIPLVEKLRNDYLVAQVNFFMDVQNEKVLLALKKAADDGTFGRMVQEKVSEGYKSLASIGLPSYQAPDWLSEMSVNLGRLSKPEFVRGISPFITKYTSFFKAYAVSSPGFVVRNTMGNTFMLFAAGADIRSMNEGLKLFGAWRKAVQAGGEAAWIESLPASQRGLVKTAIAAMDASGYGRGMEAVKAFNPNRKWLVDNKWVRTFRKANEVSEGSARFILAWDSMRKGYDFDAATARVKRYLFDYESTSAGDEVMRSIIPFWFWTSRNLPMQIVNQYENPRAYLLYQKAMKAVSQDDDEEMVPSWLKESGGVKIGTNTYLAPDLGFNRIGQQFEMLKTPKRLLSDVNPALRLPIEMLGNRRMYNDVPFGRYGEQPVGGPASGAVEALASLLGQQKRTREGDMGVAPQMNYALMNLIPPLAQTERLLPATELYKGKQGGSILSWFGVPIKQVTPQMREAEQRRRQLEQEALRKKMTGG